MTHPTGCGCSGFVGLCAARLTRDAQTAHDAEAVYAFTAAANFVRVLHAAGQPIDVELWCDAIREQVNTSAGVTA